MPEEKITYEKVQEGIETIKKCANTMDEIFRNVTGTMRNMTSEENFQGVASNALSGEFDEFKGTFPNYIEKVNEFAAAYDAASQLLKEHEQHLEKKAVDL